MNLSNTKILSVVVRVAIDCKIHDVLFGLFKVTAADVTSLYNIIVTGLIEANIDYKKILIGFAADGVNNMAGKNHSVAALLKLDF